ncbi:ABC transporter substrate-binding protein [Kineosporia sp. NBRC 101677]|nr:ABC transporter substrate-binding protein [Kineosporia sp. NBRC 101677]
MTACSSGSSTGSGGDAEAPKEFSYLTNVENTTIKGELEKLATGACADAQAALPLKVETVPQTQLDQKLQLLAGQDALPVQYAAGNAPSLTVSLERSKNVLDLDRALADLGVNDEIEPAALSTIKSLYGGKFSVLPYEYNIEGIWYNKELFQANGIQVPATWDELLAAAEKLKAAGITPFAASGEQGWPLTRLISNYLQRDLGPDALQKVSDGAAKLTDPAYVRAAQAIADLGAKDYFGKGVGSIDYDTAFNQFLTGKAGMFYMGSWALADFNNPERNQIGEDNVGFMPFPEVSGGQGSSAQLTANVGLPMAISAKQYDGPDGKVGSWLTCIAENYGTELLKNQQTISGFKTSGDLPGVKPLTKEIKQRIADTDTTVLWFEALFDSKATTTSQTNAAPLVTGDLSPADFMAKVQEDLDS